MEMVAQAKLLLVYQKCEKCNDGIMEYDREVALMKHLGYYHKCNKCGYVKSYYIRYPYQRIVPIEVPREPVGREIAD